MGASPLAKVFVSRPSSLDTCIGPLDVFSMHQTPSKSKLADSIVELADDVAIPPCSDKRWENWSRPLWAWLGEDSGKSWDEIKEWTVASGRSLSLTRHQIVWLELQGLIEAIRTPSEKSSKVHWRWRRVHGTLESWKSSRGEIRS
jgi:hypothetical protein